MLKSFTDGLKSLVNAAVNRRNVSTANTIVSSRLTDQELRDIYKTGIGYKIISIKSGHALKDSLAFKDDAERLFYNKKISYDVKKAVRFMFGFGRAVVVIIEKGQTDLSRPLEISDGKSFRLHTFSGDMVNPINVSLDFLNDRYMKPEQYSIRGKNFHYSRVVDFRYIEPPEQDLPLYRYGGISEFELIYNQLVNDAVVERCSPAILEKNSTMFYKIDGFQQMLEENRESEALDFFAALEDARSVFGAGLVDSKTEIATVDQVLTNLSEVDQITLRRLSLVTGIPLAILVGENVQGLNSTGDNEMKSFEQNIDMWQQDYMLNPINELLDKIGRKGIEFKKSRNMTPQEKIDYESKAVENAVKLMSLGEDYSDYLITRDIIEKDDFSKIFGDLDG